MHIFVVATYLTLLLVTVTDVFQYKPNETHLQNQIIPKTALWHCYLDPSVLITFRTLEAALKPGRVALISQDLLDTLIQGEE